MATEGQDQQPETEHVEQQSKDERNGDPEDAAPHYEDFKLPVLGLVVFFTLAVLTLMVSLDGTSISVALPKMARELNGSAMEAFWSGTSFLLCSTVFQPFTAALSDIFGRRPVILLSIGFFFAGSLTAGLAHSFTTILTGRCIQGVGGGGIAVLSEVLITDLVPLRLRGNYYGVLSAMYSLGSVLGPILGGGFSEKVTWRWIFYINFPFIAIATICVLFFFRLPTPPGSLPQKLLQIDYTGTFLFVSSLSSFLIPLSWGGIMYAWTSWRTLVPLTLGATGLLIFCIYEALIPSAPMIPRSIFQNRSAVIALAASFLQGMILWCALYYMPLYYEAVKSFSPIMAGVALFPDTFTVAPSAILCGFVITRTGHYRWGLYLGWTLSTLGLGLLCLLQVDTPTVKWIFLNIPAGLGLGILTAAIVCAVQASATPENLTLSVAMVIFFRAFGQAVGIAVGGVIFQNRMRRELSQYEGWGGGRADEVSRNAAALVTLLESMGEKEARILRECYTASLRVIWGVMCGAAGVGLGLSGWVRAYPLGGVDL
ncbi:MFS general substrate transporter [Aspergillus sclerotiicarbonarius CBS 121057]|uniref:MFS general substrate transporter n=1 Tax=Aspergillus sclerotiicarbonarius (strain CBS 121057 / IBT 28362) TaxID=1448318 RepID=A0A319DW44_ASPSB|nr:MFS general substrate transporter [Aspergillus sclerotiicarbonarius CBS 121057]